MNKLPILLSFSVVISTPGYTQPEDIDSAKIRSALSSATDPTEPGCAVGLFGGNKNILVNVGVTDLQTGRAIDGDTRFYAASVSKHFTAVAVMQLVSAGKFKLSDDIRKFLPEMPQYQRPVTIQMLLNHTGGIRDWLMLTYLAGYEDPSIVTRSQALRLTMAQSQTEFEPGTRYDYSNGGYLLLSEVVERVSGRPFAQYVNDNVLKPLGMNRSFVLDGKRPTDTNFARGYERRDSKLELADGYPLFGGSGGLITTVNDLGKWASDIDRGHKVWTAEIRMLMTQPGVFNNGVKVTQGGRSPYYASGLWVGPNWFGHAGGAKGFKTFYAHNAPHRMGMAILCNRGEIDPFKQIEELAAALGLPPIMESAVKETVIEGRYRSDDLDATYILELGAENTLKVTVVGGDGKARRTISAMKRTPIGTYQDSDLEIVPDDDARGFRLKSGWSTFHFSRT